MKIELGGRLAESAAEVPAAVALAAPLRIAFLSYRSDPRVGGQGAFLSAAAAALADRGHKVDVISGPPYPELRDDIRLIRLPSLDLYAQPHNGHYALRWHHFRSLTDLGEFFGHLSGKFMEPWSFGRRAARYLAQHRDDYDVVFDNQTLASGLLDIQKAGLPVVGVIHHPIRRDRDLALKAAPNWEARWLIRRWYSFLKMHERVASRLDRLVVISKASRHDAIPCLNLSETAMTVVPIGIDIDLFRPLPDIARLPNRLLAVISADVPLKGLRYLVEAYAQLLGSHPDLWNCMLSDACAKGPPPMRSASSASKAGSSFAPMCRHRISSKTMRAPPCWSRHPSTRAMACRRRKRSAAACRWWRRMAARFRRWWAMPALSCPKQMPQRSQPPSTACCAIPKARTDARACARHTPPLFLGRERGRL